MKNPTSLDDVVSKILNNLLKRGLIDNDTFNTEDYMTYREVLLSQQFYVPQTSITKIASRLLFAIGVISAPKVMVGAGIYTGHALSWLSGYSYLSKKETTNIYGLDISAEAIAHANNNFQKINMPNVNCMHADAVSWLRNYDMDPIDVLYIDIDTKEEGKSKYLELLEAAYPKLSTGALIIAHDVNEEKFLADIAPYITYTSDKSKFSHNINLNIDPYGLGIAKKL